MLGLFLPDALRRSHSQNAVRGRPPRSTLRRGLPRLRDGPLSGDESRPQRSFAYPVEVGHLLSVWRDDHVLERRNPERDLSQSRHEIYLFAVVQISVGGEQDLRLDLTEAIHHALRSEIG